MKSIKICMVISLTLTLIRSQQVQSVAMKYSQNVTNNNSLLLGGLFSIHSNDGGECGRINPAAFISAEAMVFAVERINADLNILPNVTVFSDIRDTCGISNTALEETVNLIDIGSGDTGYATSISGVVGAAKSDVTISVARLLRIFQIPQISHASTATELNNRNMFDYFFRTIPPDNFQARAMADLIVNFNWTYVIALYTDDTYGRGGINSLMEELNKHNDPQICLVSGPTDITALSLNDDVDYTRIAEFLSSEWVENATVVVMFVHRPHAEGVLKAAQRHPDLSQRNITWIASDAWATRISPEVYNITRGMLGIVPKIPVITSFDNYVYNVSLSNSSMNPWLDEFLAAYNCDRSNQSCKSNIVLSETVDMSNTASYVIDAVYSFAHALHNAITETCPRNSTVSMCQDILIQRFSRTAMNGTILRDNIYRLNFTSLSTNDIIFDNAGDQRGYYDIKNLRHDDTLVKVGEWDNVNSLRITGDIEWRGESRVPISVCSLPCGDGEEQQTLLNRADCCWTCRSCLGENTFSTGERCEQCDTGSSPNSKRNGCELNPITFLRWSSPWAVVILIGTSIGLIAVAFVVTIFIIFNRHKIIKATSRELSVILLTGIALCYVLPFFFLAEPSPFMCAIRRFGIGFCFSLCFSPLLMKTNRIYRVFHEAPRTPRYAGPLSQVLFSCGLILVQVIIGSVWLILERPSVLLVHRRKTTEKKCGESPYSALPILLSYSLLLLVLSTYYAFRARKIPANFNETKFIGITLYSICIIWLGFIPTYFATITLGSIYQTSSLVIAVLLSASTTLSCLFIPKVLLVFIQVAKEKEKKKETKQAIKVDPENSSTSTIGFALY